MKYATLPRIIPRVATFFSTGFEYAAFLMAHLYFMVRLLPQGHPYLSTQNIGRFSIRHVITEATRNLRFSWKHADQLFMYLMILSGIVLIAAQVVVMAYALLIAPVMATSLFVTPVPAGATALTDIAYTVLDRVFGVPGVFCSNTTCTAYSADINGDAAGAVPMPAPYHLALQGLFRFYSTGLLLIATLIFLYYIVVVVVETVTSGTPFGQRFKNIWVPVRLVVAIGLLLPLNYGLNSSQYIVLYAAKMGSSLATNGWIQYNEAIRNHAIFSGSTAANPVGERYTLLAIPEAPDMTPVIEAMSLVHACAYAYHRRNSGYTQESRGVNHTRVGSGERYPLRSADYRNSSQIGAFQIQPFFVKNPTNLGNGVVLRNSDGTVEATGNDAPYLLLERGSPPSYLDALGFYYGGDIVIRFGEYKYNNNIANAVYSDEQGGVKPLCGDIVIPVTSLADAGGANRAHGGADQMLRYYFNTVMHLWFYDQQMPQYARNVVEFSIAQDVSQKREFCSNATISGVGSFYDGFPSTVDECMNRPPGAEFRERKVEDYKSSIEGEIVSAWQNYVNNNLSGLDASAYDHGWAGAGIWYNQIAEMNAGWMDGVLAVPKLSEYPQVMQEIESWKKQNNPDVSFLEKFNPSSSAKSGTDAPKEIESKSGKGSVVQVGVPLYGMFMEWNEFESDLGVKAAEASGNVVVEAMKFFVGVDGFLSIRGANAHLHPMAQLVVIGKGLVDSAVVQIATAATSSFGASFMKAAGDTSAIPALLEAASSLAMTVAFIGLTAGIVLYYVLPFMPFVYFFFQLASWVKTIFEAMVGAPLWALAHLRIDGEGLPGDAAQNGYFLIFDIALRPILTLFGLIAAILIFSTQVRVLNVIWDLVSQNVSGFTSITDISGVDKTEWSVLNFKRSTVDNFFFTLVYTIVCYMLALASFKLIDRIPDNILRWAGSGVSAFGDINQDNVETLTRYAVTGGMTIGQQAAGAIVQTSGGVGGAFGKEFADLKGKTTLTPEEAQRKSGLQSKADNFTQQAQENEQLTRNLINEKAGKENAEQRSEAVQKMLDMLKPKKDS